MVEKASCDEAYIDVTRLVVVPQSDQKEEAWAQSHFWGHKAVGEGSFEPVDEHDIRLRAGAQIAWEMRQAIDKELGYKASCGISHNKTMAKLGSA